MKDIVDLEKNQLVPGDQNKESVKIQSNLMMIAMNNVGSFKLSKVQDQPLSLGSGRTINRIQSEKTINQMSDDTIKEDEDYAALGDGGL